MTTRAKLEDYPTLLSGLGQCSNQQRHAHLRHLARTDLYFLLRYILGREDIEHQWLFDRCCEVETSPNGHLDLWSREHYKSTIITFGKTIQDILASHGDFPVFDREMTFGIFSASRPLAVKFMSQIKREFESNDWLRELFPDILWDNPRKEASKWSLYTGMVVKRKSNPKEATIEAYGLVDGMPTGGHWDVLIYDDIVTVDVVRSPEMIEKVTDSLALSYNLGARGGVKRMIGTRYHFADSYAAVINRGTFSPRIYPATDDGTIDGEPVLLDKEELKTKRRDMGPYVFSCQMMQNPLADASQGFQDKWIRFYDEIGESWNSMNRYILVDPAHGKRKTNDYTSMWCLGLGEDGNYYALDVIRDRLNLTERADALMKMHRKWRPIKVGYERYGMQADIEAIRWRQEQEGYRFEVVELGGKLGNDDRVRRLVPIFEQGRMWLPVRHNYTDYEGKLQDLINIFINEEYLPFPVGLHPDMLDSMSRILDDELEAYFPQEDEWEPIVYDNRGII
jgi:phage terminase large subunit-like protein